jgi:hypothetical protein
MKGRVAVSFPLTGTNTSETFAADAESSGLTELTQDYYTAVTKDENLIVVSPYLNASDSESQLNREYDVLPSTGQGTYTLTVSVNGEPKTTIVPAEYMDWKPGYLYTYIFKVNTNGAVIIDTVQSAFTSWIIHENPHTVYNW